MEAITTTAGEGEKMTCETCVHWNDFLELCRCPHSDFGGQTVLKDSVCSEWEGNGDDMGETIRLTGALTPREKGYNEGYKVGYEKGKADALGWTPIEEKLPDVDEDGISDLLMLSYENYSVPDIGRYYQEKDGDGWFGLGDEEEPLSRIGLFVNAWRPMLEPYRG